MKTGQVEQAIDGYEALMKLVGDVHELQHDALTLVLDLEFLVYQHPSSTAEQVEEELLRFEKDSPG